MVKIEVFDPPMCCSTGVCGPEPDERLARFSADLDWLGRQGLPVRRYNLSQEPAEFTSQPEVARILRETDGEGLPVVIADGRVVSQGNYPSRQQLAELVGLSPAAGDEDGDESASRPADTPRAMPTLSGHESGGGCCGGTGDEGTSCC